MKTIVQRVLASLSIMAALAAAVTLNASDAAAASSNTCAVGLFIPLLCPSPAVGPQEGLGGAQNQPVVDFLGVVDQNPFDGVSCRAQGFYSGGAVIPTADTSTVAVGVSAHPAGSAAGWFAEPPFQQLTAINVNCL